MTVKGLDKVLKNLNKEIQGIEGRSMKGLIRASVIVRRSMDNTSPKIPVDTGNLRSSWFVVTSKGGTPGGGGGFKGAEAGEMVEQHERMKERAKHVIKAASAHVGPAVMLGFSASYAVYVHENIGATFQRPEAGAKFFQASLSRNQERIKRIIREEARLK
jgi:hypothetical protein